MPGALVLRARVQALEEDEDPLGVLGVDPDPVVGAAEAPELAVARRRRGSTRGARLAAELDRVRDQVLEDEPQQRRRRRARSAASPATTISAPLSSIARPRSVRTRSTSASQSTSVCGCLHPPHARERQQVVDQVLHAPRAVDGEADVLVGARVELAAVALLEQLAEARDLAQRLLEVVRGDVGELLELGVGAPQVGLGGAQRRELGDDPRAHRVDVLAELDDLARAGALDLALEVPARDVRAPPRPGACSGRTICAAQHERHRAATLQQHHDAGAEHPEAARCRALRSSSSRASLRAGARPPWRSVTALPEGVEALLAGLDRVRRPRRPPDSSARAVDRRLRVARAASRARASRRPPRSRPAEEARRRRARRALAAARARRRRRAARSGRARGSAPRRTSM